MLRIPELKGILPRMCLLPLYYAKDERMKSGKLVERMRG
jgi:hypothetical protein